MHQPLTVRKHLLPGQDLDRFAQTGRPKRIGLDKFSNGMRTVSLDDPHPTGTAPVALEHRPGSLDKLAVLL